MFFQNILFLKLWKSTSMTTYVCCKEKSSLLSRSRKSNILVSFSRLNWSSKLPCLNLPCKLHSHLWFYLQRLTSGLPPNSVVHISSSMKEGRKINRKTKKSCSSFFWGKKKKKKKNPPIIKECPWVASTSTNLGYCYQESKTLTLITWQGQLLHSEKRIHFFTMPQTQHVFPSV